MENNEFNRNPANANSEDLEDTMREAVSDFRKATFEFSRGENPDDHARMIQAQKRIFETFRVARLNGFQTQVFEAFRNSEAQPQDPQACNESIEELGIEHMLREDLESEVRRSRAAQRREGDMQEGGVDATSKIGSSQPTCGSSHQRPGAAPVRPNLRAVGEAIVNAAQHVVTPADLDEDAQRIAFEKHFGPKDSFAWRNQDGSYKVGALQSAWEIWKAAMQYKGADIDSVMTTLAEDGLLSAEHRNALQQGANLLMACGNDELSVLVEQVIARLDTSLSVENLT